MANREETVQKRSGGGVERRRAVPLWGPLTVVVVVAVGALLVMQVQTLPDPLPPSAHGPIPARGTPVDTTLAMAGQELYKIHCSNCHRSGATNPEVGPPLDGVTKRRPYPWIRGMVMEPDSLLRADSAAHRLLLRWRVPMRDVGLTEPAFRAVLEYMRLQDEPPASAAPPTYGPTGRFPEAPDTGAFGPPVAPPSDSARGNPAEDTEPPHTGEPAVDTVGGSRPDPGAMPENIPTPPPLPRDTAGGR